MVQYSAVSVLPSSHNNVMTRSGMHVNCTLVSGTKPESWPSRRRRFTVGQPKHDMRPDIFPQCRLFGHIRHFSAFLPPPPRRAPPYAAPTRLRVRLRGKTVPGSFVKFTPVCQLPSVHTARWDLMYTSSAVVPGTAPLD